jgi:hypothetical protein
MRHSAESIFGFLWSNRIEFLREFEAIFKTDLAHESWYTGVPFNEKIRGSKISRACQASLSKFAFKSGF